MSISINNPGNNMQRLLKFSSLSLLLICATVSAQDAPARHSGFAGPKRLAPGVLKVLPTLLDARDTYTMPRPLRGLNATKYESKFTSKKDTLHGQTQRIVSFRHVWQYEFAFTGLRQASFVVPHDDGQSYRKNVWYMVYRIRNLGKSMTFDEVKKKFDHVDFELKVDEAKAGKEIDVKFLPRFSLEGWAQEGRTAKDYKKVIYRDEINPAILRAIRKLEDPRRELLDTFEMSKADIPVIKSPNDDGVWGVAIWENVNPTIDYVSVFASGLTNAYRIESKDGGEPTFRRRTLQLNFWRPGDTVAEDQDLIDFGIPMIKDPREQIEICYRYDLPGPLVRGFFVSPVANQNVQVIEVDAEVNLREFTSALVPDLNSGKLPESIQKAFADVSIDIPADVRVRPLIPNTKWGITADSGEYILKVEPQYWEPKGRGIRFIKSLDHLWIYR